MSNYLNIFYNSSCVDVVNEGNVLNLGVNTSGILRTRVRIVSYNCSLNDYKISYEIQGYNTKKYFYNITIPISYITYPANGSLLFSPSIIKIVDKNVNKCYINIGNKTYQRPCYNNFIYNKQCQNKTCTIFLISENNFFTYISNMTFYKIPLSQLATIGISAPDIIELKDSPKTITIEITNNKNSTECYTLDLDLGGCAAIGNIKLNKIPISHLGTKTYIGARKTDIWELKLYPVKYCIETAELTIQTCSPVKTFKKEILLRVISSSGSTLNIKASEKINYVLLMMLPFLIILKWVI